MTAPHIFADHSLAFSRPYIYYISMKIIFSFKKDNSIVVRRCLSPSGEIVLPSFIEGRPVTELAPYAFSHSELGIYESAFIFDCDENTISECTPENEASLNKDEEVICDRLLSIALPETLLKVGRYCFYNCGKLRSVSMYSTTIDLGFGMFTGCTGVRNLDMTVTEGRRSSLNDVLVNIRFPLKLTYREALINRTLQHEGTDVSLTSKVAPSDLSGDLLPECTNIGIGRSEGSDPAFEGISQCSAGQEQAPVKYRLIFPEYYENSKENTPARITVRDMQGSGYMYRNCFANTMFQIKRYDSLFPYAEALEPEETVCELALCRLETPTDLSQDAREKYISYLRLHAPKLTELLISHYENNEISMETLRGIASYDFVTEDYLSKMTDTAVKLKKSDILSVLMDVRHEKFRSSNISEKKEASVKRRRFSL